jgi:hypothetical protein
MKPLVHSRLLGAITGLHQPHRIKVLASIIQQLPARFLGPSLPALQAQPLLLVLTHSLLRLATLVHPVRLHLLVSLVALILAGQVPGAMHEPLQ